MKKLIGHEFVFNKLIGLYNNNNLPNKILVSGTKGIGKSLLANQLVNYIYSKNDSNLLIENNSHPNIFKISKEKDKKYIEISKIREMIQFQNRSSFNNKIRSIIIDDLTAVNTDLEKENKILWSEKKTECSESTTIDGML